MDSIRQKRINQLLKEDLSTIFQTKDSVLFPGQMVSVTHVSVTPDLGLAKVALSLFPHNEEVDFKGVLEEYKNEIRFELGKKVRHQLRVVPELKFYLDDSLDRLEEIEDALKG